MNRDDFCVFIISYERADGLETIDTLDKCGYTGDFYIVVDDEDSQLEDYRENYGDKVVVFNKDEVREQVDMGDNRENNDTPLLAREAIFDIADELGVTYFLVLDDDYTGFELRWTEELEYKAQSLQKLDKDLDEVFDVWVEYFEKSGADAMTLAQGGDFIGGSKNELAQKIQIKRKAMNSWMLSTDRYFPYVGRMNDDVNTYIRNQQLGNLMYMVNHATVIQRVTQSHGGGLTELYLDQGTYVKTFYSVMYCPSCIKIGILRGQSASRIHHKVEWDKALPKILSEEHKK